MFCVSGLHDYSYDEFTACVVGSLQLSLSMIGEGKQVLDTKRTTNNTEDQR